MRPFDAPVFPNLLFDCPRILPSRSRATVSPFAKPIVLLAMIWFLPLRTYSTLNNLPPWLVDISCTFNLQTRQANCGLRWEDFCKKFPGSTPERDGPECLRRKAL